MTPAARVAAAIEILEAVGRGDAPADAAAAGWFRGRRFAGSGDRRAVRELVYRDLRRGALLRWAVSAAGGDGEAPRLRMFAALALADPAGPDGIDAAFAGTRHGPSAPDAGERRLIARLRALDRASAPGWARANCPEALFPLFGVPGEPDPVELLAALNAPAPVDLRVNTLRATRAGARARLAGDGYACGPTPYSPLGLRGTGRGNFDAFGAFRGGLVEPQDESSQLVALLTAAAPGMRVVDHCAGAGGKALALAAAMENRGEILACDVSAARLARIAPRAARLGVRNVRTRTLGSGEPGPRREGWADRVLVDAPCSGTGRWRRSPDLRWRTTPASVADHVRVQDGLLDAASAAVRPGGRLVYAVCSLLAVEGRARVDAFLARAPAFRRMPAAGILGGGLAAGLGCADDLVLAPHRHGTDGMYAAALERAA